MQPAFCLPPQTPRPPPATLETLPDDLVLEIVSHFDLDTVLSFRFVNRRIHQLLKCRIRSLAYSIVRNTPVTLSVQRLISEIKADAYDDAFAWLKALRTGRLASLWWRNTTWLGYGLRMDVVLESAGSFH
jgi:hypothetical protein